MKIRMAQRSSCPSWSQLSERKYTRKPWNLPVHPRLQHKPQSANVICTDVLDMEAMLKVKGKIKAHLCSYQAQRRLG